MVTLLPISIVVTPQPQLILDGADQISITVLNPSSQAVYVGNSPSGQIMETFPAGATTGVTRGFTGPVWVWSSAPTSAAVTFTAGAALTAQAPSGLAYQFVALASASVPGLTGPEDNYDGTGTTQTDNWGTLTGTQIVSRWDSLIAAYQSSYPGTISKNATWAVDGGAVTSLVPNDQTTYNVPMYVFTPAGYESKTVIFIAGIHPQENYSLLGPYLVFQRMLKNWKNEAALSYVINKVRLIVIPCLNMWGRHNSNPCDGSGNVYTRQAYSGYERNRGAAWIRTTDSKDMQAFYTEGGITNYIAGGTSGTTANTTTCLLNPLQAKTSGGLVTFTGSLRANQLAGLYVKDLTTASIAQIASHPSWSSGTLTLTLSTNLNTTAANTLRLVGKDQATLIGGVSEPYSYDKKGSAAASDAVTLAFQNLFTTYTDVVGFINNHDIGGSAGAQCTGVVPNSEAAPHQSILSAMASCNPTTTSLVSIDSPSFFNYAASKGVASMDCEAAPGILGTALKTVDVTADAQWRTNCLMSMAVPAMKASSAMSGSARGGEFRTPTGAGITFSTTTLTEVGELSLSRPSPCYGFLRYRAVVRFTASASGISVTAAPICNQANFTPSPASRFGDPTFPPDGLLSRGIITQDATNVHEVTVDAIVPVGQTKVGSPGNALTPYGNVKMGIGLIVSSGSIVINRHRGFYEFIPSDGAFPFEEWIGSAAPNGGSYPASSPTVGTTTMTTLNYP